MPVRCTVELFGVARRAAGRRAVPLELTGDLSLRAVVAELSRHCPELAGKAIAPDRSGLLEGYILNLNGRSFVASLETEVSDGDNVLLLTNEAGG